MDWVYLILAGLFEMSGVGMINQWNQKRSARAMLLLVGSFAISFAFLALAMMTLPMGTAYAVWTGIGASGGALLGMIFYGEARDAKRILFIAMVLVSAVGLKFVS
ncbi:DMT family transporter [Paenibacillus gallinarum]|uniref:Multidrug efflux SMR transporter n=1 Tax=Paenibacillus gallinarum TaxID=2762232 RepID=A0ABR8SZ19_9BACL|nr:multidrug efflux SMR transporter [Paenibacillus gallinarum]MBD7968748.1 multidrug efflux SMR transporter [Paenibacillus gallinarum]